MLFQLRYALGCLSPDALRNHLQQTIRIFYDHIEAMPVNLLKPGLLQQDSKFLKMQTVKVLGIVGRQKPISVSQSVQVRCADYEPASPRKYPIGLSQEQDLLLSREMFYHVKQQSCPERRILEGQPENISSNLPIDRPAFPIRGQIVRIEIDANVADLRLDQLADQAAPTANIHQR